MPPWQENYQVDHYEVSYFCAEAYVPAQTGAGKGIDTGTKRHGIPLPHMRLFLYLHVVFYILRAIYLYLNVKLCGG